MSAHREPSFSTKQQRVVRVFVSSTFRDMLAERDCLVKFIFPQLRKLCEARGVTWSDVDLRWGITEEETERGEVLPVCLALIQRCRPYFIGLLGERYGWVPDEVPQELIEQEPWLQEHLDHSVTELEILHGVLNNPQMADHALFYFRDPAFVESLASDRRRDYLEFPTEGEINKYGRAEAERRAGERSRKLIALKARIRASGLPVRENYTNPEALGELVLRDLTEIIERRYPADEMPDPLDREALDHEAFAESRAKIYIGRQSYYDRLDEHARSDGLPLVVLGESGSGKSALLSNWALRYRSEHPDELLLMHFIGATPYSSDWAAMLRRIMGEFKRRFDIQQEIPDKPDALRAAFANWLHMAAAKGKVVLILDALNQLEDRDGAPDLVWLPPSIPPNIRLILSTLPGRPLEDLVRRGWPTMQIELLDVDERKQLILAYLGQYAKQLSKSRAERIASAAQTANPLYLRALLEELRVFGIHEELDSRIEHYLSAQTVVRLYEKILARYEQDYERERPGLVREAMSLLWAARRGLSEAELLDLLGTNNAPLPRAHWSPLHLAAEQSLVSRSGLIGFGHDYLRQAVRGKYLLTEQGQHAAHLFLADYFGARKITEGVEARMLDEFPWQLQEAGEWQRLRDSISDISIFMELYRRNEYELLTYWLAIGARFAMIAAYKASIAYLIAQKPNKGSLADILNTIAEFLRTAGHWDEAEPLYRQALSLREEVLEPEDPKIAQSLYNLGELLRLKRNYVEAASLYRRARPIWEETLGPEDADVANTIDGLAGALHHSGGEFKAAGLLYDKALRIRQKVFGPDHPHVAYSLNNLGLYQMEAGRYEEAEASLSHALQIWKRALGQKHPEVATALYNLATVKHEKDEVEEAEKLHHEALVIREEALGPTHPHVAQSLNSLAGLMEAKSNHPEAEKLFRQALEIREQVLDPIHPELAESLIGLAELLGRISNYSEAEKLCRRGGAIREKVFGVGSAPFAVYLNNLAELWKDQRDYLEAEKLHRQVLAIREKVLGPKHQLIGQSLNNLATVLHLKKEFDRAEPLYRRALDIYENAPNSRSLGLAFTLSNLAVIRRIKGDYSEAEVFNRRALGIREEKLGPNHTDVAHSLNNLAMVLKAEGHYATAKQLYLRTLAIIEPKLGQQHPFVITVRDNLAVLILEMLRRE